VARDEEIRGKLESVPVFDILKYQFPVSFRLKKENHGNG